MYAVNYIRIAVSKAGDSNGSVFDVCQRSTSAEIKDVRTSMLDCSRFVRPAQTDCIRNYTSAIRFAFHYRQSVLNGLVCSRVDLENLLSDVKTFDARKNEKGERKRTKFVLQRSAV